MLDRPELTKRQRAAYSFICAHLETVQRPPTLVEIAEALDLRSVNSVSKLLASLEKKGYVEREAGRARGIRLLDADRRLEFTESRTRVLPIREPPFDSSAITAAQLPESVHIDECFLRGVTEPRKCFLVRSCDHGMAPDGILRGDLVVVEPVSLPRLPPTILIACLADGEYLIRRYAETATGKKLIASDRTYPTISLDPPLPSIQISGRVLAVLRRL